MRFWAGKKTQAGSATMAEIDDYDAIAKVIDQYIKGAAKGDIGLLFQIFHEKARLFGEGPPKGTRYDLDRDTYFQKQQEEPLNQGGKQIQGAPSVGAAIGAVSDRHRRGRRLLGRRVVRRHLLAVADQRPMEDRQQDLHLDRRRGVTRSVPRRVSINRKWAEHASSECNNGRHRRL